MSAPLAVRYSPLLAREVRRPFLHFIFTPNRLIDQAQREDRRRDPRQDGEDSRGDPDGESLACRVACACLCRYLPVGDSGASEDYLL